MAAAEGSVADVYQSLKAALDISKSSSPETDDVPSKKTLILLAEQVKNDAAKVGLMCSGGAPPADQQLALAKGMQQSCVAFCIACHAATATAGPSLKTSLTSLAQNLVHPCLALIKDMGSGKDLKSHVGLVWERVSAVSKVPADNKACLFSALAKVMAVLQDTLREMEELQEEQQEEYGEPEMPAAASSSPIADENGAPAAAGNASPTAAAAADSSQQPGASSTGDCQQQQQQQGPGSSSQGGSKSGPCDDDAGLADLDFEADEMSYWERQVLTASIQLLKASTAVLKAFGKALLQGPALPAGSDGLDSWENCVWHTQHLQRAVEDLGAAMYPPQDFAEVGSAGKAVFEVAELMMDECPSPDGVGVEGLSSLSQQLVAAHEAVQDKLALAANLV